MRHWPRASPRSKIASAFVIEAVRQCAKRHGIALSEDDLTGRRSRTCSGLRAGRSLRSPDRRCRRATGCRSQSARRTARFTSIGRGFGAEPCARPSTKIDPARLALPFNRVFRYRTGLHDLDRAGGNGGHIAPSGFIFHMSRCGSTLVAQMLAALPDSVVISEAAPIDAVVQLGRGLLGRRCGAGAASHDRRLRPPARRPTRSTYFVKLDCWHTLALPLFRRAFPLCPGYFSIGIRSRFWCRRCASAACRWCRNILPPAFTASRRARLRWTKTIAPASWARSVTPSSTIAAWLEWI